MKAAPYASFRFAGSVVHLTREQFEQAVRDGRRCGCHSCLACRAVEYHRDARGDHAEELPDGS